MTTIETGEILKKYGVDCVAIKTDRALPIGSVLEIKRPVERNKAKRVILFYKDEKVKLVASINSKMLPNLEASDELEFIFDSFSRSYK